MPKGTGATHAMLQKSEAPRQGTEVPRSATEITADRHSGRIWNPPQGGGLEAGQRQSLLSLRLCTADSLLVALQPRPQGWGQGGPCTESSTDVHLPPSHPLEPLETGEGSPWQSAGQVLTPQFTDGETEAYRGTVLWLKSAGMH